MKKKMLTESQAWTECAVLWDKVSNLYARIPKDIHDAMLMRIRECDSGIAPNTAKGMKKRAAFGRQQARLTRDKR